MLGRREVAFLFIILAAARLGPWQIPAALANSSTPITMVYVRDATSSPRYCTFNGSSWTASTALASFGGEGRWVVVKNCPTRNELGLAILDDVDDVNVSIFNGSTWSSPVEVCSNTGGSADRGLALEYEHVSGKFLVAYWDAANLKIGYRTYNGSTLSSQSLLTLPTTSTVRYITLTQKLNSNELMLVAMNNSNKLYASVWNGSSFGTVVELTSSAKTDGQECFATAYETLSGNCMVVYGKTASNIPQYRVWDGSSWAAEQALPTVGAVPVSIRLVADPSPSNDNMLFASLDSSNDINSNFWNGSSWGTNVELETSVNHINRREFDLAYLGGTSGTGVILYGQGTSGIPIYRYWTGSSWTGESNGPDLTEEPAVIAGITPTNSGNIIFSMSDEGNDLTTAWSWGGSQSSAQLETTLGGSIGTERFMIATPGPTPPSPANTPYATDFQGTVGAEWSDTTTATNTTFTKYLGRFNNTTAKLALNTTIGETYRVTFDLYAFDTWDGDSTTYGPDAFIVSANNTTVFSHTFAHNNSSYGASYPYPYDQMGLYAYTSNYPDAIYRSVEAIFTATSSVTLVGFKAAFTDTDTSIDNESWGIDNVKVAPALFRDVSSAKGFNVTSSNNDWAGGMLWGDLDGDGDLDAMITGNMAKRILNNSAGTSFTSSTFNGAEARRQGALMDIDNDGDLDLWIVYAANASAENLFQNNGSATFTNIGNLGFSGPSTNEASAAADVNGDGWIDLLMFSSNGNWIGLHQGNPGSGTVSLVGTTASSYGLNGTGNTGDGDFCSAGDVNNDGYLDFFYHYNTGRLFVSNGDGTYTRNNYNISVVTGTATTNKFGSAWADYDNDGDLDLFCAHREESYSGYLWRNDRNWSAGTGNFTDVTSSAGLTLNSSIDYTPDHYGTVNGCWGDYDNDGDLDLFILGAAGNNYLYENQGNGTFKRTGEGIIFNGLGGDCCFVDYDNDGDLDLAITRDGTTALLFENQTNNSNYLKVRVVGTAGAGSSGKTNKAGVGIRVDLYNAAGTTFIARRQVGVASGLGIEPMWVHFGGVNPATTYTVKVYFTGRAMNNPYTVQVVPGSVSTTIGSTVIPQMLTVTEPPTAVKIQKWYEVVNRAS